MSVILHAVYASPFGPQPIDYLINLDGGGFQFPLAQKPDVAIPGVPGVLMPPPVVPRMDTPEPATFFLAAAVLLVFVARRKWRVG